MKLGLIEKLPVLPHMPFQTKLVRRRAPRYIKSVIEDTKALPQIDSIEELRPEHFNALGGGQLSATYLVKSPRKQIVIKLNTDSVMAEAEALREWKKRRVHVPKVIAAGVVPMSRDEKTRVKYLIQEAVVETHGRIAETCHSYLLHRPEKSRAIGRLLGSEMSKMHQAIAKRSFGDYADSAGNTAPFRTWGKYLIGYIDLHEKYLRTLPVTPEEIKALRHYILHYKFSTTPRYLHGDYSIRNALITSYDPLKITIFDPNPIIGDRSWDIAVVLNNYEYQKRRLKYSNSERDLFRRDQQIWIGFRQGYSRKIDEGSLIVSQLIHAIFQIGYEGGKKKWLRNSAGLKAYEGMITDLIKQIAKREV